MFESLNLSCFNSRDFGCWNSALLTLFRTFSSNVSHLISSYFSWSRNWLGTGIRLNCTACFSRQRAKLVKVKYYKMLTNQRNDLSKMGKIQGRSTIHSCRFLWTSILTGKVTTTDTFRVPRSETFKKFLNMFETTEMFDFR